MAFENYNEQAYVNNSTLSTLLLRAIRLTGLVVLMRHNNKVTKFGNCNQKEPEGQSQEARSYRARCQSRNGPDARAKKSQMPEPRAEGQSQKEPELGSQGHARLQGELYALQ